MRIFSKFTRKTAVQFHTDLILHSSEAPLGLGASTLVHLQTAHGGDAHVLIPQLLFCSF